MKDPRVPICPACGMAHIGRHCPGTYSPKSHPGKQAENDADVAAWQAAQATQAATDPAPAPVGVMGQTAADRRARLVADLAELDASERAPATMAAEQDAEVSREKIRQTLALDQLVKERDQLLQERDRAWQRLEDLTKRLDAVEGQAPAYDKDLIPDPPRTWTASQLVNALCEVMDPNNMEAAPTVARLLLVLLPDGTAAMRLDGQREIIRVESLTLCTMATPPIGQ